MINHDEAQPLLADLLSGGDEPRMLQVAAHAAACAACAAEVCRLRYADAALRAAGPPPLVSAGLAGRLAAITEPAASEAARREARPAGRRRRGIGRVVAWQAAAVAACLALVVLLVSGRPSHSFAATEQVGVTTAAAFAATRGDVALGSVGGRRAIRLRLSGLAPVTDGFYELWIAESATDRVSLGPVVADTAGRVDETVLLPALDPGYRGVWITRQPARSGPGWTTDWVMKARFA